MDEEPIPLQRRAAWMLSLATGAAVLLAVAAGLVIWLS